MGQRAIPHPAKAFIVARGERIKDAAERTGYDPQVVGSVLSRRQASWPAFRRRFAAAYGVPEAELFWPGDVAPSEASEVAS